MVTQQSHLANTYSKPVFVFIYNILHLRVSTLQTFIHSERIMFYLEDFLNTLSVPYVFSWAGYRIPYNNCGVEDHQGHKNETTCILLSLYARKIFKVNTFPINVLCVSLQTQTQTEPYQMRIVSLVVVSLWSTTYTTWVVTIII